MCMCLFVCVRKAGQHATNTQAVVMRVCVFLFSSVLYSLFGNWCVYVCVFMKVDINDSSRYKNAEEEKKHWSSDTKTIPFAGISFIIFTFFFFPFAVVACSFFLLSVLKNCQSVFCMPYPKLSHFGVNALLNRERAPNLDTTFVVHVRTSI